MNEEKKSGKFITTIIIGGALGSIVAWIFGNKKRREKVESIFLDNKYKKNTLFSRWFKKSR